MLAANEHTSKRVAWGTRRLRTPASREREESRLAVTVVDDIGLDRRRSARVGVRAKGVVCEHLVDPFRAQDAVARLGIGDRRLCARRGGRGLLITGRGEGRSAATRPSSAATSGYAEAHGVLDVGRGLLHVEYMHVLLQ